MRRLRILTWHVHGSYLYYLSHIGHEIFLPVADTASHGYLGRTYNYPWPDNVYEIPADDVRRAQFDVVLFQSRQNFEIDQLRILSAKQQKLPRLYLEHDPPREHPTDTVHPAVSDPDVVVVHVTHFNRLMWDCGSNPTRVVEHGVVVPEQVRYTGEIARGAVVINNIKLRGRRLGYDLFVKARQDVPLDLVGMASEGTGGLGELSHAQLAGFVAKRRFFYNPIRYTSLGLAVCEAMMMGCPIVGLATTELATVIECGVSGYIHTDPQRLIEAMQALLRDQQAAQRLGAGARRTAIERFSIGRFITDWHTVLGEITASRPFRTKAMTHSSLA